MKEAVSHARALVRTCRLIIFRRNASQVLLIPGAQGFQLPSVDIPQHSRLPETLTKVVKELWACEAAYLFITKIQNSDYCVLVDRTENSSCDSSETCWHSVASSTPAPFFESSDGEAVLSLLGAANSAQEEGRPFSHLQWPEMLENWVAEAIRPLGLELSGRFRQLNRGGGFDLIRFDSNGPAVWFKAVAGSNLREFRLSPFLAQRYPEYVPNVIAVQPEWNGWLSLEAEGDSLGNAASPEAWHQAAGSLARLQIASLAATRELLALGARDARCATLEETVDPFFAAMAETMARQSKAQPPPLTSGELLALRKAITAALKILAAAEAPDTLGHLDLNPENIIKGSDHCVFLDWAEGYVGYPFFSLEYMVEHLRRSAFASGTTEQDLRQAYWTPWQPLLPKQQYAEADRVLPLLAVFAYAVHLEGWRSSPDSLDEMAAGYLRSLARRMQRESAQACALVPALT